MVKNWKEHIDLQEAWSLLRERICPLRKEMVFLASDDERLPGSILAEDIVSRRNIPHFNASAVDGYALNSSSTSGAAPATPCILQDGAFQWVNTGAPVEDDFDCVLMVEDSSFSENGDLIVFQTLSSGDNVRPVGEDVFNGQIIGRKGDMINPAMFALFPSAGIERIGIFQGLKVIFLPTGDEIIPMEEWLASDKMPKGTVMESNSLMLRSFFSRWGISLDISEVLPDDPGLIREQVLKAVDSHDLILIGAGSAKGKKDHIANIINEEGELLFHWLLMKPGRPAMAGLIKDVPVVDMPGFPMSTAVVSWSIVYPIIRLLLEGDFEEGSVIPRALGAESILQNASLLVPHSSPSGMREWVRVKVVRIDGTEWVFPLAGGSSTMWSMAESDGITLLDPKILECPKGTRMTVWLTRHIPWERRILYQGSNDPGFDRIISYVRENGGDLVARYVGSLGGLAALRRKECHMAAVHLIDAETGEYNTSYIDEMCGESRWFRKTLFHRQQGIIIARGNPKNISSVRDLCRDNLQIVNRQNGAGTRVLLDMILRHEKIDPGNIQGYDNISLTHFDAANRISAGLADAAIGIKAAADALDLDFIPLTEEPFEIVIPEEYLELEGIKAFLKALEEEEWKKRVIKMGGYRWTT